MVILSLIQPAGIQKAFSASLLDRIVAAVNEEVITWSELMNTIIIDGRQMLSGMTGTERQEKIRELERPVLNGLIEMKLQLQVAHRMDLDVSESEIDGAINDIRKKYGLTEEDLMNSLKNEGLNREDYRKRLGDQILLQKVINFAVRNNVVVSDKEAEQHYNENMDKYDVEEKLRIRQIFFVLPGVSTEKKALEARAREIVNRIRGGEDFAQLAREYSEDPSSEFGGDLGFIRRGSALKEVEDAAAELHIGEVSNPFWSSAGLHIIKLEDKVEGGDLDKIKSEIKEALFQRTFEEKYREWKAELREKSYIEIKL